MVWFNECSSNLRFELTGDFYEEVLRKFQGTQENSSSCEELTVCSKMTVRHDRKIIVACERV